MRLIDADALVADLIFPSEAFEKGFRELLDDAPTVEPERRKGRWRKGICECGYDWAKDAPISSVPNFCPNCGADMREEGEE